MRKVITIDGPSGVGKGTLAQGLARKLNWVYLDSGALFRAAAWALEKNPMETVEARTLFLRNLPITFQNRDDGVSIFFDGEDISAQLRTEECAAYTSQYAAKSYFRRALLQAERGFMPYKNLIADGRDMGTVVFPEAALKIYLTARVEVRAERRYQQLKGRGGCDSLARLIAEISARDERDMNREIDPLKPASDAVVIDSSFMSIGEVLAEVESLIAARHLF